MECHNECFLYFRTLKTVISYDTVCLCRFYLDKDIEML